ncbi:MAG TPA: septum formation initiator family protein [Ktedonobacteraceae bacterium]|nr:septum formation initiator family protein [Ktedonobacteraceae bacterium]
MTSAVGLQETAGRLRARRSSLFTQTIIWITGLICLAFLLGTLAQAWSNSQLMQNVQKAQQQLQQAQDQNAYLRRQASYYKDPFVIESEARQQLGYIRPGEHPIIIVSSTSSTQPTTARATPPPAPQSYWQEWWQVFFGN